MNCKRTMILISLAYSAKNDASIRHHFSVTNVSAAHLAARDFYHFIKLLLSLERCRRKFPHQDHQLEFVKKQWLQ